ncbi:MAG: glycosyltransferase [Gammaproteobacteria bacterium]|nr:glycosyltransferase [Gammaproteobacteria bacterium]
MKIFVTVGTTRFNTLIRRIISEGFFENHECILQTGPGGMMTKKFECFEYTSEIDRYYDWADIVVSHAGAGSIYRLLSLGKRIVLVPNVDRIDQHQLDIATFMHNNNYAIAVYDFNVLSRAIENAAAADFISFESLEFFVAEEIITFIDQ